MATIYTDYTGSGNTYRIKLEVTVKSTNASTNTAVLSWRLYPDYIATYPNTAFIYVSVWKVVINGKTIQGSPKKNVYGNNGNLGSGTINVSNASGKKVNIAMYVNYYTYSTTSYNRSKTGSITIPVLAVDPTLPTSISASGGTNNWINKDSPTFNVSWSGATSGTYTIDRYSIDASKDAWSSSTNVDNLYTSATSGSKSGVSLSALGLTGGETVRIKVGMHTSNGSGKWWGNIVWGSSFHIYSVPKAPTTFNVPSSQEIDTPFNVSWSGATAGSEGISKYQLQRRVYNGSSWGDWVTVLDKNATSYSAGTPKSITGSNSDAYQIQFRVRVYDGYYGYSDWVTKTVSVLINSPSTPRK